MYLLRLGEQPSHLYGIRGCTILHLQFKGFDPEEMSACTLLFEGTAEVRLCILLMYVRVHHKHDKLSVQACYFLSQVHT